MVHHKWQWLSLRAPSAGGNHEGVLIAFMISGLFLDFQLSVLPGQATEADGSKLGNG